MIRLLIEDVKIYPMMRFDIIIGSVARVYSTELQLYDCLDVLETMRFVSEGMNGIGGTSSS